MKKATHYGKIEIVPGIQCDSYVLDDNTAVLSERGTANLLDMDYMQLVAMRKYGLPDNLTPFVPSGFQIKAIQVEVTAANSPYNGKTITVYTAATVETIMLAYAMAFGGLRKH